MQSSIFYLFFLVQTAKTLLFPTLASLHSSPPPSSPQIVNDTLSEACVRITQDERQKMKALFGSLSVLRKPPAPTTPSFLLRSCNALIASLWHSQVPPLRDWQPNTAWSRTWILSRRAWRRQSSTLLEKPGKYIFPVCSRHRYGPKSLQDHNCRAVFIFVKTRCFTCVRRVALAQVCRCCQCPTVESSCWRRWRAAPPLRTTSEFFGPTRVCTHSLWCCFMCLCYGL